MKVRLNKKKKGKRKSFNVSLHNKSKVLLKVGSMNRNLHVRSKSYKGVYFDVRLLHKAVLLGGVPSLKVQKFVNLFVLMEC